MFEEEEDTEEIDVSECVNMCVIQNHQVSDCVTQVNEPCHTYEWAIPHTSTRHVTHIDVFECVSMCVVQHNRESNYITHE